jgi:hypothetical protein
MVGSVDVDKEVLVDVVVDEGETGVPSEHAAQTALTLRTKAAGRYLIAKPPIVSVSPNLERSQDAFS